MISNSFSSEYPNGQGLHLLWQYKHCVEVLALTVSTLLSHFLDNAFQCPFSFPEAPSVTMRALLRR